MTNPTPTDLARSHRGRKALLWLGLSGLLVAGTVTVAHATLGDSEPAPGSTAWIAAGQPVSASQLKGNLLDLQAQITDLGSRPVAFGAHVTNNGTTCTLVSQVGNHIGTPSRPVGGKCDIPFVGLSAAPICTATCYNASENVFSAIDSVPSASTIRIACVSATAGLPGRDSDIYLTCVRP